MNKNWLFFCENWLSGRQIAVENIDFFQVTWDSWLSRHAF